MTAQAGSPELVNIKIDGKDLQVPKGMNMIEAAKTIGIEIPHYCYHQNLSVVGNCRMCKVQVAGMKKLEIGCNLAAREGLEVSTQETSQAVKDAQAATLEFILINHPLDCTVCDQAGHCKLQDYHYAYNARPSRFLEEKEHKVKAEPLGPTVMLDGERCIMCTRCIRFCDEVTGTSELGMLNRGDRAVIAINPGRELNNPLSGTVVDLCPVGALTHREWRFNTRIWFTKQTDSICPGCSTGCNVKVAERDGAIVQVKARMNQEVNKEWLCDEGRYGFERFRPDRRIVAPLVDGVEASWEDAAKRADSIGSAEALVFVSPDLLLEEYAVLKTYLEKTVKKYTAVVAHRPRKLTSVEAILVSPDYAANYNAALYAGLVSGDVAANYEAALAKLRNGGVESVICIGERAIFPGDCTADTLQAIANAPQSLGLLTDADSGLAASLKVVFGGRSILEKSGLMINSKKRLQYAEGVVGFPEGSEPEWRILHRLAQRARVTLTSALSDRELTLEYLRNEKRLSGMRIRQVKQGGVCLERFIPGNSSAAAAENHQGAER